MKALEKYALVFIVVLGITYAASKVQERYQKTEEDEEYDLIRMFLLNESPLYGYNKPKMWIHTTYEMNARKWRSFYSRNSTDLNQPYIHLTVRSLLLHCGDDFNICLVDDDAFAKLIPMWDVDMGALADPAKTHMRALGLAQLVAIYGGMVVPNSFVCLKNLMPLYQHGIASKKPFVGEHVNRTLLQKQSTPMAPARRLALVPDTRFMGARKHDPVMRDLVTYLKQQVRPGHHVDQETDVLGESSRWCLQAIDAGSITLIEGNLIGTKSRDRSPILLETLMDEAPLELDPNCYGIWIPNEEILARVKYQWFAVLPAEEVIKTHAALSRYLKEASVIPQ